MTDRYPRGGALRSDYGIEVAAGVLCWPVGARVGNVRNNDASLIEPVPAG
jgi:hypothetical protein